MGLHTLMGMYDDVGLMIVSSWLWTSHDAADVICTTVTHWKYILKVNARILQVIEYFNVSVFVVTCLCKIPNPSIHSTVNAKSMFKWLTLHVQGPNYSGSTFSQYHGYWCPGSFRRQGISTHDINYVEYVSSCLARGRISTTYVKSVWRKGIHYTSLCFLWKSCT